MMEFHLARDGMHIKIKCSHMDAFARLPIGPSGWTVVSTDPLTIIPSILNQPCGCHGFITEGKWVAA